MSWQERYLEHEVWQKAEESLQHLHELVARGDADAGDPQFQQLRDLLEELFARREYALPAVTTGFLDTLASQLATVLGAKSVDELFQKPAANRNSCFGDLASRVRQMSVPVSGTLTGLENRILGIEASVAAVQRRADSVIQDLDGVEAARREEIERHLQEVQSRLAAAEGAAEQARSDVATQVTRLDSAISEFQERFAKSQSEKEKRFAELLRSSEEAHAQTLDRLKDDEAESRRLLETIGVNATATHYAKYANEQQRAADIWRRWAAGIFITAAAWFVLSGLGPGLFPEVLSNDRAWWQEILGRWGGTVVLLAAGAYASRESNQHRQEERASRKTELIITALGPFTANLDRHDQVALRQATARALFVNGGDIQELAGPKPDAAE